MWVHWRDGRSDVESRYQKNSTDELIEQSKEFNLRSLPKKQAFLRLLAYNSSMFINVAYNSLELVLFHVDEQTLYFHFFMRLFFRTLESMV